MDEGYRLSFWPDGFFGVVAEGRPDGEREGPRLGQQAIGIRLAFGAVVVLLIVALILLELFVESFREAFLDHVIAAAFVTGVLVIGLTSLVVDALGRAREYWRSDAPAFAAIERLGAAALEAGVSVVDAYSDAFGALDEIDSTNADIALGKARPEDLKAKRGAVFKEIKRLHDAVQAAQDAVARAAARCEFVAFRDDVGAALADEREAAYRLDEVENGLGKMSSLSSQPDSVADRAWRTQVANRLLHVLSGCQVTAGPALSLPATR